MRRCLARAVLLLIASAPALAAPDAAAPDAAAPVTRTFALEQVAPGVFVHFGQPLALDAPGHDDIANIGFVVGRSCVAVIDTGGSTRIGRALRAAIRQQTPRPICYVINTHVHVDHVLGNFAFLPDHPSFVGHATLPDAMARSRRFFLTQYAADLDQPPSLQQIIAPDRLVESSLELDLGGRRLQLRAWPKAHTDCDLTVLDEQSGTLWTGDLLFRERLPAVDGDVAGWLTVIDELARLQVRRAVPGHGPLTTDLRSALAPERIYLRALLEGVREDIRLGRSMQQAIADVAVAQRPHWLLWDSTHPRNVARVYEQLEWQ
ncbi:MAG TPA: quinoprotein relay system zinc metallohydrolase 2 [Steroidobacteraceae bacterium]